MRIFGNGSRPRSSVGRICSGSGFRTGLCARLAVRRSIIPSTAGACASARSAASRLPLPRKQGYTAHTFHRYCGSGQFISSAMLEIRYESAWNLLKRIRKAMGQRDANCLLSGLINMDDQYGYWTQWIKDPFEGIYTHVTTAAQKRSCPDHEKCTGRIASCPNINFVPGMIFPLTKEHSALRRKALTASRRRPQNEGTGKQQYGDNKICQRPHG